MGCILRGKTIELLLYNMYHLHTHDSEASDVVNTYKSTTLAFHLPHIFNFIDERKIRGQITTEVSVKPNGEDRLVGSTLASSGLCE